MRPICELNNSEISSNHDSCSNPTRRSIRDPALAQLDRSDVRNLLAKIHENHPETIILKIKNQLHADINSHVMDAIIAALNKNRVCQALYAQNLTKALGETQLAEITKLCSKKKIWCVNLGENYNISTLAWERFCRDLATTFITHLYVSEHTINIELKNRMRDQIRANRKKHELHCSMKNIAVIEKCTNVWWYVLVVYVYFPVVSPNKSQRMSLVGGNVYMFDRYCMLMRLIVVGIQ